ncbi:MAG: arylesterase [Thiomicrorhabdus chilensis]|nr:arylesterase [Thiomicrorhabdus chilensis]
MKGRIFKGWRGHILWLFLGMGINLYPSLSVANSQDASVLSEKPVLLVFGDSLSAAYGMDQDLGWVALMQSKRPQLNVINASISGETTSGGKQRLPALLKTHQPNVLILELGANDALRGQNLQVSQQNLQVMIDLCQTAKPQCRVVLLGIRLPTNYGPAYDRQLQLMYQNLAQRNQLVFDPFFIETVALDPDLMQFDGLHPNADAQPLILQRVWPLIEKALPSSAASQSNKMADSEA